MQSGHDIHKKKNPFNSPEPLHPSIAPTQNSSQFYADRKDSCHQNQDVTVLQGVPTGRTRESRVFEGPRYGCKSGTETCVCVGVCVCVLCGCVVVSVPLEK